MRINTAGAVRLCWLVIAGTVAAASLLPATAATTTISSDAGTVLVQPGSKIQSASEQCTLSWLYRGQNSPRDKKTRHRDKKTRNPALATYASTARHCVSRRGERWSVVDGQGHATYLGTVAYISSAYDFALIRLSTSISAHASPEMAGHPQIPSGAATSGDAHVGDVCQFSGHGEATDRTSATQQDREAVLDAYQAEWQSCEAAAISPGDSGGPVADTTDAYKALGLVSDIEVSANGEFPAVVGEGGVSIQAILSDARRHGFPLTLETVSHK